MGGREHTDAASARCTSVLAQFPSFPPSPLRLNRSISDGSKHIIYPRGTNRHEIATPRVDTSRSRRLSQAGRAARRTALRRALGPRACQIRQGIDPDENRCPRTVVARSQFASGYACRVTVPQSGFHTSCGAAATESVEAIARRAGALDPRRGVDEDKDEASLLGRRPRRIPCVILADK